MLTQYQKKKKKKNRNTYVANDKFAGISLINFDPPISRVKKFPSKPPSGPNNQIAGKNLQKIFHEKCILLFCKNGVKLETRNIKSKEPDQNVRGCRGSYPSLDLPNHAEIAP
jgi:hypothetical protein